MKDPIGAFESLRGDAIRYIQTRFETRFDSLEKARKELLERAGQFFQTPFIEATPRYQQGNMLDELSLDDLPGISPTQAEQFKCLCNAGLFKATWHLYQHQQEMLKAALEGNNCIITSGTGSGKTEAFLLPLFAHLVKESESWCDHNTCHPRALRSLLVYPMNALVEDQMTRMRVALDSEEVHNWFQKYRPGHHFYFGRYNSATPVSGHRVRLGQDGNENENGAKLQELHDAIETLQQTSDQLENKVESSRMALEQAIQQLQQVNNLENQERVRSAQAELDSALEVRHFFPRMTNNSSEMVSRWDMQEAPPDILITNFSMLGIMLMRHKDQNLLSDLGDEDMFRQTKEWLAGDPSRVFHLIVDELHLYRGSAGTEVAYLIRVLLHRLGLYAGHQQLRILASSASLAGNGDNFLRQFFGFPTDAANPFTIIPGNPQEWPAPAHNAQLQDAAFAAYGKALADMENNILEDGPIIRQQGGRGARTVENENALEALAKALNFNGDLNGSVRARITRILMDDNLGLAHRLTQACAENGTPQPITQMALAERVFPNAGDAEMKMLTLRGLLAALAEMNAGGDEELEAKLREFPSFRLHWICRNIPGLWAAPMTTPDDEGRTAGRLYTSPGTLTDEHNHRVLELFYCECCGTTFFAGNRRPIAPGDGEGGVTRWELLASDPDLERLPFGAPEEQIDKRKHSEIGLFWPSAGHIDDIQWDQQEIDGEIGYEVSWKRASLNPISGIVSFGAALDENHNSLSGYLYYLNADNDDDYENHAKSIAATPHICPSCEADYRKRLYQKSPIRAFRTGLSKMTQILSLGLFKRLDDPKLVAFSDSRQGAAVLANGVEQEHWTDLLRVLMCRLFFRTMPNLCDPEIVGKYAFFDAVFENKEISDDAKNWASHNAEEAHRIRRKIANAKAVLNNADDDAADLAEQGNLFISKILRDRPTPFIKIAPPIMGEDGAGWEELPSLVKAMVSEGRVNPVDSAWTDQAIQIQRRDYHCWTEFFNDIGGQNPTWCQNVGPNGQQIWKQARNDHIRDALRRQVMRQIVDRSYFDIETLGLGHVALGKSGEVQSCDQNAAAAQLPPEVFTEVCQTVMRLLGEGFRYQPQPHAVFGPLTEWVLSNNNNNIDAHRSGKYMRKVADLWGVGYQSLRDAVYSQLQTIGHSSFLLQHDALWLKLFLPDDLGWYCPRCHRVHLHASAGVCSRCFNPMIAGMNNGADIRNGLLVPHSNNNYR